LGAITLLETVGDAQTFVPKDPRKLAYVTQTTLSVDDTTEMVDVLKGRFPAIAGPAKEDICYATTNRQTSVKAIANRIDALLVVGAPNSSNSLRLVEVAQRQGCPKAFLVQRASEIPWDQLGALTSLGITAGASAPETLVTEVIDAFKARYDVAVEIVTTAEENIAFNIPRELRDARPVKAN
jgi:4-hydroxy-3-methylbut-2-en-1-yl diphosphate reductase